MRFGYGHRDPRRYNRRGEFIFPTKLELIASPPGENMFTKTGTKIQPNDTGLFSGVASSNLPRIQFKASGDLVSDAIWTVTGTRIQPI